MKGLLVILCALVTLLAVFAGGCAVIVGGVAALGSWDGNFGEAFAIIMPFLTVLGGVMGVNIALIMALGRGQAPRRTTLFVLLAVVDLLAATALGLGIAATGDLQPAALLPAALALKGVLTLLLPARPPALPSADDSTSASRP